MADCLTLLRQYNTQKKEIVERDSLVIFEKTAWPKTAKTNYLLYRFLAAPELVRINWNGTLAGLGRLEVPGSTTHWSPSCFC
jgi:hypothetical protein